MEVCSLHHTESQGYEMRVGNLREPHPDYKNLRKHSTSPYNPAQGSLTLGEMKRTHSERDSNLKKPTHKISQKLQLQCSSPAATSSRTDKSEFHNTTTTSLGETNCEIFLGGSCNPTSWRKDIVIPILNHSGISFFNPQVSSWYPELIKAENEAKSFANCLFFVIDSETRAVASVVEVAYLIAQGKNVTLVMTGLPNPGQVVCGEPITESETRDLANAQTLLRQLSAHNKVRVFDCIRTAVQTTATLLRPCDNDQGSRTGNGCRLTPVFKLRPKQPKVLDVFCTGSSFTDVHDRLKKYGLGCWTDSCYSSSLIDDPRIEDSKLLFFHLSTSFRGLETLILAAYFIGLSKNVILCIEDLDDGCVVGDEVLSKIAIKDYNRGRTYLREVADRHDVPVFSSLASAVDGIIAQLTSSSRSYV